MRLWSLHPKYLDAKGLVALWREGLLAQAVLAGRTRGYMHHPQLTRFLRSADPGKCIGAYLGWVHAEAIRRGYKFDEGKIDQVGAVTRLAVTRGQLEYEWHHLTTKLSTRAPTWLGELASIKRPQPHPMFRVVAGDIAPWEVLRPN
jgi:pyrimidine dimer DNA glycosylase